ncbi:MAG: hypothetical protein ABI321_15230 [Polyangia bacterium]
MASTQLPQFVPQFVLRLVEGKGLLGLKSPVSLPLGRLERLDLEIPNLRFPFDGSGEPDRFRNRRCSVRDAALRIDEEQLSSWLATRPLGRYGIEELRCRLSGDAVQLAGALVIGDRRTAFTCRAQLVAVEAKILVQLEDFRTYHSLPAAAPLVGLALLYALGARPAAARGGDEQPGFVLRGIDSMEVDALSLSLWRALLPAGWRLPRSSTLDAVRIDGKNGALTLGFFESNGLAEQQAVLMPLETRRQLERADAHLAAGELAAALEAYELLGTLPVAIERRVATLLVVAGREAEAEALARELVATDPERGSATTLLALALSDRGAMDEAAALFQRAAVLAERAGEPAAAIEAALRAAELLIDTRPTEATPLLERVVAGRGTHTRAAQLLADRYASEGRNADLLRLEKRRLSQARGQEEEAQARVRLGSVWLDANDDALRARDELERALRLFPGDAPTFRLYARALERSGDVARAYEAMEQALAMSDATRQRHDRLAAVELADRAGRPADARRHLDELLEESGSDQEVLQAAAQLAANHGRLDDAISAYERAASASDSEAMRASLYFTAAQLCLGVEGQTGRARMLLDRAREANPSLEILRAAAALAAQEQRFGDLDELLEKLGQLGDREARVRRIELLIELDRPAEAAAEAEVLATAGDSGTLQLLVDARRAEGSPEPLGRALERLASATRNPAPRIELGRLRAQSGELAQARIVLEEVLPLIDESNVEAAREAMEVLCDVLMRQGDDASLEAALGKLAELRLLPDAKARALVSQGGARARLGKLELALDSYREAVAADATDLAAQLGLGDTAHALRLWDEARAALEHVFRAQPRADRAIRLGEISERQNRLVDAVQFYDAALEIGTSGADAQRLYSALAHLHHARGEWEAEARMLLRAAEDARTPDSDATRAGRLVTAADLLRRRVNRLDEAEPLYDRALTLDPHNLPALDALEAIAVEREDWARAAQVLSRKVAATARRPTEQKAILGRLAVLQSEQLGRDDAAREAYQRVLVIDPRFRPALVFLARDARTQGQRAEELERLQRLVALGPDPADPSTHAADIARLARLLVDASRFDEGEVLARGLLAEQPRHAASLALLDEVFSRGGRNAELETLLGVRAQIETDYDATVEILLRRGALLEQAGRVTDAIASYERVTSLRPAHLVAWGRLAELLRGAAAWPQLAHALGRLAEQHTADGRREEATALLVEQAHVLHDRLDDAAGARAVLEDAREGAPGSRLVIGGLLALARGAKDEATEASLLDQLIGLETDPQARGVAVFERARTLSGRGDHDGALRRLRALAPEHATDGALRLRIELEQQAGQTTVTGELLEILRTRAEADRNSDLERYALEQLLQLHPAQPTRLEAVARRLVQLEPRHRDALRVLADVAAQRSEPGERAALLERLLDESRRRHEGAPAEATILLQLAELSSDPARAAVHLREAVEAAPADARAHRALGLNLAAQRLDVEAAQHLALVEDTLTPAEQLVLAELYERLGQTQRSAKAILAAGELASASRRATAAARLGKEVESRTAALEAIRADGADAEALGVLLAGLSPAATITQLEELIPVVGAARAAELLDEQARIWTTADAQLALERALELVPTADRWAALARVLDAEQAATAWSSALLLDPTRADAALGRSATLSADEATLTLERALAGAPASVDRDRVAVRLGELYDARGNHPAALAAFTGAMQSTDHALGIKAARAVAAVARALDDGARAEQALTQLLDSGQATDADVRTMAELFLERQDAEGAVQLLERLAHPGPLYAVALDRAGEPRKLAEHLVRQATGRPWEDARHDLLRAAQLLSDTLDEPQRAVEILLQAVPLGTTDATLWERLGLIQRDRLGDADAAARSLARAYAADPSRRHLLQPLAEYHHQAGEWQPARDYYRSLLEAKLAPPELLPVIHRRLAEYARLRADSLEQETHLRAAVELAPDVISLRRLVDLYREREDKLRLEQALLQLADLAPDTERLGYLREARDLMGHAPQAELDERIFALDRGDEAARERLLRRLREAEDPTPLLDRLERELDESLSDGTVQGPELAMELGGASLERGDLERAARVFAMALKHGGGVAAVHAAVSALRTLGRAANAIVLVETQLARGDEGRDELDAVLLSLFLEVAPERALPHLERARMRGVQLSIEPPAYRRLLAGQARFEELATELDRAAVLAQPEQRATLLLEAAELFEGPLHRPREAARRLAALFDARPERRDLAARARTLYLAGGEPIYALGIVDKELANADADEMPQLKITRGEILLAADADAEAEAEFLHALITTKRVGRAHAALADVYRKRGDLASALEHLIAAADAPDLEPSRAAACAVDAADVLLAEGDTATAERLYQLAAALDPADRRALDALIRVAAAQHDHERQAELLGRAATLTADRRERARLLHERARLFEIELGRDLDAYRAYREAVACDPTLREAVRALRTLAEARGEWAVAGEQLHREAALTKDDIERARLHLRLAQIHEEKLFDSSAALRNLEQAAHLFGTLQLEVAESPWASLVRLYSEAQRHADAAEAADQLVASLPDEALPTARAEAILHASVLHARAGHHELAETRRAEAQQASRALPLYDDAFASASPAEQRRLIEDRLATVPAGEARLTLLRRLVSIIPPDEDLAGLDRWAQKLLAEAPDDQIAFLARRRVLELRKDVPALVMLLRSRAAITSDARERAERHWDAGRLGETQLHDITGAAADYEAALEADPEHVPALDALADLSFRTRHLQRARALYDRLGDRSGLLASDEVARRRGELAEESGDLAAARTGYAAATALNPGNLAAQQALARVAMRLGDERSAYAALRAVLELLPRESMERAVELRLHLGELAARLGELADARALLESLLAEDPDRRDVQHSLTDVYERTSAWREAAALYERRLEHADRDDERGELLFRRGEALLRAGEHEDASDAFLKAADLNPTHAPTLRRLVRHYLSMGELQAMQEVVEEIEALGAPLGEAAMDAGIGISLRGDEARGAIIAALAQPTPTMIADSIAALPWPAPASLEVALRTALRAAGGGNLARERLVPEVEAALAREPGQHTLRFALALLYEQVGRRLRARQQLELVSFLAPPSAPGDAPDLDARIVALANAPLPDPSAEQVVARGARGPLRDALCDLGPLVLGLAVAPLDVEPAPEIEAVVAPVAALFGYPRIEVALLGRLADPAWCEPCRPPRLLLQRRLASSAPAVRFAAASALHALHAGLGLLQGRAPEDITALLRAAAATFLPDLRADGPFVRAWQAELSALGLRPETLPETTRARLEVSLATLVVEHDIAERARAYAEAERLTANRVAYAVTGDLRAGLEALAGTLEPDERAMALREDPALIDLVEFALSL